MVARKQLPAQRCGSVPRRSVRYRTGIKHLDTERIRACARRRCRCKRHMDPAHRSLRRKRHAERLFLCTRASSVSDWTTVLRFLRIAAIGLAAFMAGTQIVSGNATAMTQIYAKADWYRERPEPEREWQGVLRDRHVSAGPAGRP